MELPTYTNIWKIEKRLYKLYDFRLPMPLPVGQIATFLVIGVPYTLILTMVGMPFSHTWLWLYLLPPGVLAWLVTRPVLEGKRLPELVLSQLRYLGEPKTWCRMAPLAEKDEVYLFARAWRSAAYLRPATALSAAGPAAAGVSTADAATAGAAAADTVAAQVTQATAESAPERIAAHTPVRSHPAPRPQTLGQAQTTVPDSAPAQLVRERATAQQFAAQQFAAQQFAAQQFAAQQFAAQQFAAQQFAAEQAPVQQAPVQESPSRPSWPLRPDLGRPADAPAPQPVVQITAGANEAKPLNMVERALRSSPAGRPTGRRAPVVVVPGGHRPGQPDHVQRDQARTRLPLPAPAKVVVLGCTSGAGQTVITLLTGQLLASLRGEPVAVLDLSPGEGSLTEQARSIPVLLPSQRAGAGPNGTRSAGQRGLQVVTADGSSEDAGQVINSVVARYRLMLADPDAGSVPKSLRVADQLILVAPANEDAATALAMTLEWLEAHDYGRLASAAIVVLNGVSVLTSQHASKAASVASGRCRAIVRVPWDERLRGDRSRPLGLGTVHACTALAGVLVSGLKDAVTDSAVR